MVSDVVYKWAVSIELWTETERYDALFGDRIFQQHGERLLEEDLDLAAEGGHLGHGHQTTDRKVFLNGLGFVDAGTNGLIRGVRERVLHRPDISLHRENDRLLLGLGRDAYLIGSHRLEFAAHLQELRGVHLDEGRERAIDGHLQELAIDVEELHSRRYTGLLGDVADRDDQLRTTGVIFEPHFVSIRGLADEFVEVAVVHSKRVHAVAGIKIKYIGGKVHINVRLMRGVHDTHDQAGRREDKIAIAHEFFHDVQDLYKNGRLNRTNYKHGFVNIDAGVHLAIQLRISKSSKRDLKFRASAELKIRETFGGQE